MSKLTMQAVVQGVEPKIIKQGQPDQRTIYEIIDGDGQKWTAWERELAERAYGFKGQIAMWECEQKPSSNPKYGPNRTLLNIGALGDSSMHEALDTFSAGETFGGSGSDQKEETTFDSPGTAATPERTSIHRQTAAKVAATLATAGPTTPQEFWENVEYLIRLFETGLTPFSGAQTQEAFSPRNEEPPPLVDDGIPF